MKDVMTTVCLKRLLLSSTYFVAALALIAPAFGQSCAPPPSGLVSWWPGEGNGNDIASSNNGTLHGNVTFAAGEVNQAFSFDGNSDAVVIGNPASLQLQDFTIEVWAKRGSTNQASLNTGGGLIISYGSSGYGFGLLDNGTLFLTAIGSSVVQSVRKISDTAFHHLAVTKNGSNVVFYVDGVADPTMILNVTFSATTPLAIGARGDTLSNTFLGLLDEVSVYNRALSASEIQSVFNAGTAGKCVASPPVITVQPVGQTVPQGSTATFSVTAAGSPSLSYQWQLNSNNVPEATNATLMLASAQATNAGNYSVVVSNAFGTATSSNALLTVNLLFCAPPPSGLVSWWPGESNATDIVGGNNGTLQGGVTFAAGEVGRGFVFSGSADGVQVGNPTNLQLQNFTIEAWVKRSSTNQASLTAGGGLIFSHSSNGWGFGLFDNGTMFLSAIGSTAVQSVQAVTNTAFHHVAVTKNGSTVVFYVDGVADPAITYNVTFQTTSPGAIGAIGGSLANSFLGEIDEISIYNRGLGASEIQAIFNAESLGKCMAAPPTITTQPVGASVLAGSSVTFNVIAAGSPALSFQWQLNSNNLPGATNASLTLANLQSTNAGNYDVVITNAYGAVTSSVVTLAVSVPPSIVLQPQNDTVLLGGSTIFFVSAQGSNPLDYQWRFNGTNIVGATNYILELENVQTNNAGAYTVVVTNAVGSITSSPAMLTLLLPPAIVTQPSSQTNFAGGNVLFTVVASGSPTLAYQWQFGGTNITGATNSTLQLFNIQFSNTGNYSVVVTNAFGMAASSNAMLTVDSPICDPPPAGLVSWWQAEGDARDSVGGNNGNLLNGAAFGPGKVGQAFNFNAPNAHVRVHDAANLHFTNGLTIDAWVFPTAVGGAQHDIVSKWDAQTGFNQRSYSEVIGTDGRALLAMSTDGIGSVDVFSTNTIPANQWTHVAATYDGTALKMYINGALQSTVPETGNIFHGTNDLGIGGTVGGAAIGGVIEPFAGLIDEASIYNRALSASEIQSIYDATTLGKCSLPLSVPAQPTNQSLTVGGNIILSVPITGTGPVTYQWFQNGVAISGATNATLAFTNTTFFQAGTYTLVASNSLGSITSSNFVLTVKFPPLLVNGSFETGDFTGWVTNDLSVPLYPLTVRHAGFNPGFGFFLSAPTDGSFAATHGFEGDGPGKISIAQDVALPSGPATLTFDYRAAWDMSNYPGSTLPRTFAVTITPAGGGTPLQTFPILTAAPGTADFDTGPISGSLDLTAWSDRGLRISFDATVPEFFTGPGFFQLDNVALSYSQLPPLVIAQSDSNIVLSWPASTTNYTLQTSGNLSLSNSWSAIDTNLITRAPTNTSVTLPITTGPAFYRLSYP